VSPRPPRSESGAAPPRASGRKRPGPEDAAIAGVVGDVDATRSGQDTRRRGWFWHWNSIVTQFAPLIGLKGVGLLNSYTVWTDRREESPHRGYAFPSQQSEADFYGEDRAELIAINKILVALDLIEIRKEMVLRVDERGRRWKVPHNFYRVKDHGDGFVLGPDDVLRVVELADADKAIYRCIRHIFSSRFAPIDAENVWVGILEEVSRTELWQRLATRAAAEENRASARTRAGHAARKAAFLLPKSDDTSTNDETVNDSSPVKSVDGPETIVASANKGSTADVDESNNGFDEPDETSVAPANAGRATSVEPSNRTYNQSLLTTTTTRSGRKPKRTEESEASPDRAEFDSAHDRTTVPVDLAGTARRMTETHDSAGPGGKAAPENAGGELRMIKTFEDANGRRASAAEKDLLRTMAERFEPAARVAGHAELGTGADWVTAAIYEAVAAGSAFVAPRRIREILARWERDGIDPASVISTTGKPAAGDSGSDVPKLGEGPDLMLPHGFGSRRTWAFVIAGLRELFQPDQLTELFAGTAIVDFRDGTVAISAPDAESGGRLAGEYRELIRRRLSDAMDRPVRIEVVIEGRDAPAAIEQDEDLEPPQAIAAGAAFIVRECGLPSGQVWAAVLDDLQQRGEIGRANFESWLRITSLLGRGADGSLVVGVPHALARKRIVARFIPAIEAAVFDIVGVELPVEIVVTRDWLSRESIEQKGA
jgi:hypothetical protein